MKNPTISFHEPWASLVASGIKTIETRSWATSHRGLIFIHAAAKPFGFNSDRADLLRDHLDLHQYRKLSRHLYVQRYGKTSAKKYPQASVDCEMFSNYVPSTVIAVATLVDVLPIVTHVDDPVVECVVTDFDRPSLDHVVPGDGLAAPYLIRDISPEIPWGDYTPGRFAWILGHIRPLDVCKPVKGRQRIWEWKDGPFE